MRIASCLLTVALLSGFAAPALADGLLTEKKTAPLPVLASPSGLQTGAAPVSMQPAPAPAVVAAPVAPVVPAPVAPAPAERVVEAQPESAFLGLSVGLYDAFSHGKQATAFNLEFQPGVRILGVVKPLFGFMATTQDTMYGYGGLGVPMKITDHVKFMPSVAFGAYTKGDGVDLGKTGVMRLGGELAYQFDNQSKFGINGYVLTNAESAKREDRTEVLGFFYSMPLSPIADPAPPQAPAVVSASAAPPVKPNP